MGRDVLAEELGEHGVGVGGGELAGVVLADVGGGFVVYGGAGLEDGPGAGGGGGFVGGYDYGVCVVGGG